MPTRGAPLDQQLLGVIATIDNDAQRLWTQSVRPSAGTGAGDMYTAIGLRQASNHLRKLLGMPAHSGFKNHAAEET